MKLENTAESVTHAPGPNCHLSSGPFKALTPAPGETVVEKALPNAFAGTELAAQIEQTGKREIVIAGFMTHMCVSATARAALDLGLRATIDADACATRPLPDGKGGALDADLIHRVALAELADRFAIVRYGGLAE